jgi:hypothetical protein
VPSSKRCCSTPYGIAYMYVCSRTKSRMSHELDAPKSRSRKAHFLNGLLQLTPSSSIQDSVPSHSSTDSVNRLEISLFSLVYLYPSSLIQKKLEPICGFLDESASTANDAHEVFVFRKFRGKRGQGTTQGVAKRGR